MLFLTSLLPPPHSFLINDRSQLLQASSQLLPTSTTFRILINFPQPLCLAFSRQCFDECTEQHQNLAPRRVTEPVSLSFVINLVQTALFSRFLRCSSCKVDMVIKIHADIELQVSCSCARLCPETVLACVISYLSRNQFLVSPGHNDSPQPVVDPCILFDDEKIGWKPPKVLHPSTTFTKRSPSIAFLFVQRL